MIYLLNCRRIIRVLGRFTVLSALLCSLVFAVSCSDSDSKNDPDDKKDEIEEGTPPSYTPEMIERSLISTGNNYRIKKVLSKARSGEKMTIAFIGGSITQGYNKRADGSYVYGTYEKFQQVYGKDGGAHISCVNAGMGGTPSTVGMIRYKRDVLDESDQLPDLVVVEFAVNDADDPTEGAAYESLVKTILQSENAPAVVLLFSVFKNHWNLQDRLSPVGEAYDLPMVSIKDAIVTELENGSLDHDDFFRDDYHPTAFGFELMTACLVNYLEEVDKEEEVVSDIELPASPVIGDQFTNIKMIDSENIAANVTLDSGSFSGSDNNLSKYGVGLDSNFTFPENWHKVDDSTNTPFEITLTAKNMVIVYKKSTSSAFGTALVSVDGGTPLKMEAQDSAGWNNPWTLVAFDNDVAAEHTVQISMEEDDKDFTIMAIGYTE